MLPRTFPFLSLILLLLVFGFNIKHVVSSPVTPRPNPQWHNGQAVLQPTPMVSRSHGQGSFASRLTTILTPTTMATLALRKRDASSPDASSISSVLATGLPISILSLVATNPAAASSWLASEVLQPTPTGSWYRALPTDIKSYLISQASAATETTSSRPSSTSSSSTSTSTSSSSSGMKDYSFAAAAYHMSSGAVAGVVLGSLGFVALCYAIFAWQARLGPCEKWAAALGARPRRHGGGGYERAASRAALRREFKGSRLDLTDLEDGEPGGAVEMREGVVVVAAAAGGDGKDGKVVGGRDAESGVLVEGARDGNGGGGGTGEAQERPPSGDRESVVTALPRYRPSVFGNAAGWKAGWPSVWLSRR